MGIACLSDSCNKALAAVVFVSSCDMSPAATKLLQRYLCVFLRGECSGSKNTDGETSAAHSRGIRMGIRKLIERLVLSFHVFGHAGDSRGIRGGFAGDSQGIRKQFRGFALFSHAFWLRFLGDSSATTVVFL